MPTGESLIRIQQVQGGGDTALMPSDKDYSDYTYAQGIYNRLIDSWLTIIDETIRQRAIRYAKDAQGQDLRDAGIIKSDETYTPVRLIDSNIRAEQPATIAYLVQSRRSIIFASSDGIPVDGLDMLEADFTTKMRYVGWEIPFIRCEDGAAAHGWDAIERIYDQDAPAFITHEHIGHDCLLFSVDCESIESQEIILIRKNLTAKQLRGMVVDGGFDTDQVEKVISISSKQTNTIDTAYEVYKIYVKKDGIVYIGWHHRQCDGYLKSLEPLFMGRRDVTQPKKPIIDELTGMPQLDNITQQPVIGDYVQVFEKEFPVIVRKYIESSDPKITQLPGRCILDEPDQEAASAILSGFVNGVARAANIYGCVAGTNIDANPNAAPAQLNMPLTNGSLWDKKVDFFHTPYPEASVMQGLQVVIQQNKQEQGKGVNLAAINRRDSGKTATEIQAANQLSTELSSVQVILQSIFIRQVYGGDWSLYQNYVLQGAIAIKNTFLLNLFGEGIQTDPMTGLVISCHGPINYIIKSSGDVDVIQRQETLQKLMQGWPVFGKTAIATEYLKDIIRFSFPEDAEKYIAALDKANNNQLSQCKQLLQTCGNVIQQLALDHKTGGIRSDVQANAPQLQQLAQQIQGAITSPDALGNGGQ